MNERQTGANPQAPYYPALDGLRGVAVLLVFFAHYQGLHFGWMGVNIFFVLSGFLITGILFDSQNKPHRFRNFYVRRTLRIFPLYYAVWIGLLLCTRFLHISWQPANFLWIAYLGNWIPLVQFLHGGIVPVHIFAQPLLASGNPKVIPLVTGHFWSLCIEEQFYLFWPLVVFTVRKRSVLMRLCVSGMILLPLIRIACVHLCSAAFVDNGSLHNFTFLRFDEFFCGGLAALLLRGPEAGRVRAAAPFLFWIALAALCGFGFYNALLHPDRGDLLIQNRWLISYGISLVDMMGLGLILLCLNPLSLLSRLLRLAPLRALGTISYGFYIFHDIPHELYSHLQKRIGLPHQGVGLIVPLLGTVVLAALSYNLLERPFLKLKVRFEG